MGIKLKANEVTTQGLQAIVITDIDHFKLSISKLEELFKLTLPVKDRAGLQLVLTAGELNFELSKDVDLLQGDNDQQTIAMFDEIENLVGAAYTYLRYQSIGDDDAAVQIDHEYSGRVSKVLDILKVLPEDLVLEMDDYRAIELIKQQGFIKSNKQAGRELSWNGCQINLPDLLKDPAATFICRINGKTFEARLNINESDFQLVKELAFKLVLCNIIFLVSGTKSSKSYVGNLLRVVAAPASQITLDL
ncbi:hypothetical protein K0504_04470 [Neiella marina]|uniref:Uncharacterized protein n=1 Tax=Neiella holothuriorum TaxID=2870530 RepID=A0ABS7EEC5_9GAMM|nr:hypothetical protein [Neiella holothuriorum]MBW8190283.1 hypothetical protein [Neiella holothuriorum]